MVVLLLLCFCSDQATDADIRVELKLEDEISKFTAIKMAAKLTAVDVQSSGQSTVKVGGQLWLLIQDSLNLNTLHFISKKMCTIHMFSVR